MTKEQKAKLNAPLPAWALKDHPTKKGSDKKPMSVINPMAVIDVLNDTFEVGGWEFKTMYISCDKEIQQVKDYQNEGKMKDRTVYISTVHATLTVPSEGIHIEQFGGSTNDDAGDALKGGATDALTKIASYLGIGASIYKGQGNTGVVEPMSTEDACAKLREASTLDELRDIFTALPLNLKKDVEVEAMKEQLKKELTNKNV